MSESNRRARLGGAFPAASLLASLALSGCVTHHHHHGAPVPVAHARTHSTTVHHSETRIVYHPEHRVNLVFDDGWGGYWVRELPHHYYYGGRYFRWHANRWHESGHPHGPWIGVDAHRLPRALHRHHDRIARADAKEHWRRKREERREDRREVRHEHREEKREARKERREERHETRQERRRERPEARNERVAQTRRHGGGRPDRADADRD